MRAFIFYPLILLDIHWLTWIHSLCLSRSQTHSTPYTSTQPPSHKHTHVSQSVKESTHLRRAWETEPWFSPSAAVQPQTPANQHKETMSFHSYTRTLTQPLTKQHNWLVHHPETQDHSCQGQRGRDIWVNHFWPSENFLWEEGQNRVPANKTPTFSLKHTHKTDLSKR